MVQIMVQHKLHSFTNRCRSHYHVCIGEKQILPVGLGAANIQSVVFSKPAVRQLGFVNNLQDGMIPVKFVENFSGSICGTVVDNDDFQVGVILPKKRLKCSGDFLFLIKCRYDNRNNRSALIELRVDLSQIFNRISHQKYLEIGNKYN